MNKRYITLLKSLFTLNTSQKEVVTINFHRNDALCYLQTRIGNSVHSPKLMTAIGIFQEPHMLSKNGLMKE